MIGIGLSLLLLGLNQPFYGDGSFSKAQVHLIEEKPLTVKKVAAGVFLVDFGRVAFGNIVVQPPAGAKNSITVHFGEAIVNGRINRTPPGTVRYSMTQSILRGEAFQVVAPAPDARNTQGATKDHPPAILTPKEWGTVLPFRWVEIEGWPGDLQAQNIKRRAAFATTWDDKAASFHCSDEMVNKVWELCRYSIKATTFAGMFVDGDRERIPYEADAYLNQLSYYATSTDNEMPRTTFDHLMKYGTWPTEWAPHMVFMAHADWMRTGDKKWLASRYDSLKSKMLLDRVGADGLVQSSKQQATKDDIVDWPVGERDGYKFGPLNTVVNSFHLRALKLMSEMAKALGHNSDAANFASLEVKANAAFQKAFFVPQTALYRDGVDIDHSSLHANLFPLAFGLVPDAHRGLVASWLAKRGMRCSVYAAQYLLEGLFENEQEQAAIDLMVAPGDRSWRHMVESGTTITWEAWDQKYKPNQDWNHAWGAAPANLLPRFVLGVQPLAPGWTQAIIKPHPGSLKSARGKVPTQLGPVLLDWKLGKAFTLSIVLPKGMTARVEVPTQPNTTKLLVNGKPAAATRKGAWWILTNDVSGSAKVELR